MPKQEVGLSTMKRIDKVVRRIRRKQQPELDGRITNETVAEHNGWPANIVIYKGDRGWNPTIKKGVADNNGNRIPDGNYTNPAVAGYGTAARLEFLMIPIAFGLGGPLVAMVGTNIGAENRERAFRIVLAGGAVAFCVTEAIGLAAALFPEAWLGLFTQDAQAVAVGSDYLRQVGPAFGFFGLGIGMYFALLGANLLFWPITGAVLRSAIAVLGGGAVAHMTGSLHAMFWVLAFALVVSGLIPLLSLRKRAWAT